MKTPSPFSFRIVIGLAAALPLLLAAGGAAALAEGQERQVERRVVRDGEGGTRVVEIQDDDGAMSGSVVWVSGDGGEQVRMELEADAEGTYRWVRRDEQGRVVETQELDEIAHPGDSRVHAVFIGEHAEPIELECEDPDGGGCEGFRFGYKLLPGAPGVGRGYLGVVVTELSPELRAHFGAPEAAGVLVAQVAVDSPAELAGIQVGDVITALEDAPIESGFDLHRRVRSLDEGDSATVEAVRSGRVLAFEVTVSERAVPEVDVKNFFFRPPLGEGPGPRVYNLDPAGVEDHLIRIQKRLGSPELRRDVIHLRGVENDLEQRIEELERRIQELTEALEADG